MYDYSKLQGKIVEKFKNNGNFAVKMGLSERTISLKINNKVDFKQNEITKACELLNIPNSKINDYFFTKFVQKNWTRIKKEKENYLKSRR